MSSVLYGTGVSSGNLIKLIHCCNWAQFDGPANTQKTVTQVSLLGQAVFETGFEFAGTEVGGLSGLVYDAAKDAYYALSDDRGDRPSPIPEMGSLSQYVGFSNGSYFIQVPEGEINDFFAWKADYPDLISAHPGWFLLLRE